MKALTTNSELRAASALLPAITCPQCGHKFALDEALNREIELHVRTELNDEFEKKAGELRGQLANGAAEKAKRASTEFQLKLEIQARELKEARDNERTLLRAK